jgi:hypothetical protein
MQNQLRALWVDQPHLHGDVEDVEVPAIGPVPAQRTESDAA